MEPGGFEFRSTHSQTLGQHPEYEVVFLLLGVPGNGFEVEIVVVTVDSPCAHCQAELDVGFDAAGVSGSVEQPELHGALCEECMEVDSVIPGAVVVGRIHASIISVIHHAVPDALCIVPACPAVLLHFTEQGRVDFVAPVVCTVADLQGFVEQILPPGGEVQQPAEAFGRVVRTVNVDVDTTGAVRHGTLLDQCPDDLLQVGDVLVLENRGHDLAAVGIVCLYDCTTYAPPGSDGTVSHALPYAAFAILGLVRLVGTTCKVDAADTEVVGDDGGGCSAGNARHFNLNAEVLALNRDHLCALPLVQLCSVLVVGDGVAATVLDDLDIVHLHAPDTELLVDVFFDHRSGLCGHIHRTVIAAAALVAVKPLLLGGVCFLLCAVESILCTVVQAVELLAADDLQTLIPDGAPAVFLIGLDVVLDPANNQLHTLGAEVVVERGEQHPDDLGAVGEVDVSDLALATAHRSGVDVVALCHVAVGCCGELAVNVNELHAVTLLSFWPYSVKIEGGRGKAPGSPLVRC